MTDVAGLPALFTSTVHYTGRHFEIGQNMTDVAGLALALPGLFVSAVQYFEWIQFGRHFESDFAFSLVRLEAARLHMMRWGMSIGIGVEPFDPEELSGLPADEVKTATEILHQIKRTFEAARETSESFKRRQIGILSPTSSATTSSHIL
ncbi:hypothetical protein M432DRAFT_157467 [Thermoascus aurantiacus ATCC 26904]